MGRGGTGLASCASAWSGAAVISKKDRHFIAPGTLPSIAMSQVAPSSRSREVIRNRAAELGRSSGRTAIVGKLVKNARQAIAGPRAKFLNDVRRSCEYQRQLQRLSLLSDAYAQLIDPDTPTACRH